jgi:adenylate cyclase
MAMPPTPEKITPENAKFYSITQPAYYGGAVGHFGMIFMFWWLDIVEMVWFNVFISVPFFTIALVLNRQGRHGPAFSLAFFELLFHQVAGVYFLGWNSGFQYVLIYLAGLTFFNARWNKGVRIALMLVVSFSFILLFFFFRKAGVYNIADVISDFFLLSNSLFTLLGLALLINYYVRTADRAEAELQSARKNSDEMAALLKKMFGRYLSPKVMDALIEDPASLELGGEKRSVTIMMTDLRGFTAMCERLEPEDVVKMLNAYFNIMLELIDKYNGTVNEIIGDALLVIFGAPREMHDRMEQAIACALEMQNAMQKVNRNNRKNGLPDLEMGIGLNETEVIVGNIGTDQRSKYAVVGSGVNMTSRIESYTVGGQILISESISEQVGHLLRIDAQRDILPKGSEAPLRIYEVGGIAGKYNLALESAAPQRDELRQPVPIICDTVVKKDSADQLCRGLVRKLSKRDAEIELNTEIDLYADLKIQLLDVDEKLNSKPFYGKVVHRLSETDKSWLVRFTMLPPEIDAYFQALRQHAAKP